MSTLPGLCRLVAARILVSGRCRARVRPTHLRGNSQNRSSFCSCAWRILGALAVHAVANAVSRLGVSLFSRGASRAYAFSATRTAVRGYLVTAKRETVAAVCCLRHGFRRATATTCTSSAVDKFIAYGTRRGSCCTVRVRKRRLRMDRARYAVCVHNALRCMCTYCTCTWPRTRET